MTDTVKVAQPEVEIIATPLQAARAQATVVVGVGAALVGGPSQVRDQQVQAMLSWMKCSSKSLRQTDQRLLAPWVLPIRPSTEFDPLGGLLGNVIIVIGTFVIVYALIRGLERFLGWSRNDAAAMVGWPTTGWTVLAFLHQGNCILVAQALAGPAFSFHEKILAACIGVPLCVGIPLWFVWWHAERYDAENGMSAAFRVYPPSWTFYVGAWGPNTRYACHSAFFADSSPRFPLWSCVFPLFFVLALAIVVAVPLSCTAQASTLASLFGGFALVHALLRPRRWWVMNLQGFFSNGLLSAYCLVSVGEGPPEALEKILLAASAVNATFSVVTAIAMAAEWYWFRATIWPVEEENETNPFGNNASFSTMDEGLLGDVEELSPREMQFAKFGSFLTNYNY